MNKSDLTDFVKTSWATSAESAMSLEYAVLIGFAISPLDIITALDIFTIVWGTDYGRDGAHNGQQ